MSGPEGQVEFRRVRRGASREARARSLGARPPSGGREPDLLLSPRRLSQEDVRAVAPLLGASWRALGLRLNFDPRTLDQIQLSAGSSPDASLEAVYMLRLWSELPTATVGRLATVLWETGLHVVAMQLRP
ncbi:uncharacterized protein LOC134540159 isoform X2 [Bacillus rossius redtenbacheri]